ncbi:PREDICTED: guanine nucleotide exchange factor for Rab-3A isoform X9 [Rhinopithecus bieti]|uniref:guanine nucleotide exchange factor for Rab-3A isoform X9 n=1 Tax=Rhinopithecus bieti TaxID=61621 RepID=UPI00083C7610|nr:PREDICTED: guanine nucleotide exchange factor for Rab-3A isoform X9 [Rhinopithecus bieti]XP_017733902.1 PREDICTED: guanine nucleotide exchange factor for Rab-3A isoform X9 [Rhinopithecus bieti]
MRAALQGAGAARTGAGGADGQPVRGSSQDGSRSQHEAGGVRKAAEGGWGQGEAHPRLPRPAQAPALPPGSIDMLQAEVTALKTLVITSTPASPNRELHPQLLSPTKAGPRKGHFRHKSTSSTLCPAVCPAVGHTLTPDREGKEVDTILFAEFQAWREAPTLDKTCPFLERVHREDVGPCLDFTMQELSTLVRAAVEDNTLTIEPVASQTLPAVKVAEVECSSTNTCALSGLTRTCRHRIRLGDSESHYYISPSSRARITAVCNFFTYIRYIQQGLVRQDAEPMFWEIMRLRKEMSLAKLGFFPQEA